jgi:hypothetical protein
MALNRRLKRETCDIHFSKAVRLRDGACVRCGAADRLEAMHIFGRRNKAVRWSMDNALAGCHGCHRYFTENPVAFHDFLREYCGEGHMTILREKSNCIMKTNAILRKEISDHYREEVKKKEADSYYDIVSWN